MPILELMLLAGLLFGGAAASVTFSNWARDALAAWLRENNLQQSALASALVQLDRVGTSVKNVLTVRLRSTGESIKISETVLELDQIDDPAVKAAIANRTTLVYTLQS